jgi:excisionase family DNA binding protein
MTTSEAAVLLGVQRDCVVKLIDRGILAAEKRGRDWWITRAAVEAVRKRPKAGRPKKGDR